MKRRVDLASPPSTGTSALEALLAVERDVAAGLAQVEVDAARLVAEAEARAAVSEGAAAEALRIEVTALEAALRAQDARHEAEEEQHARDDVRYYSEVSDERLAALATVALHLVLGLAAKDGAP